MNIDDFFINNRVCPQPQKWNKLWELIISKSEEKISAPLILAAWWHTSDDEKTERFRYHLGVAEKLNISSEIAAFLTSLSENDWHHKDQ